MLLAFELLVLVLLHICSLIAACHALLTKQDPRAALGWCALLIFLPIFGLAIYLVFGISRAHSRAERIMRQIAVISDQYQIPSPCHDPESFNSRAEGILAALGHKLTNMPLCPGNRITPLHNGDQAYPEMIAAINNAHDHVFLSSYIFNYGVAAKNFMEALEDANDRGVDVRVLVDGIGALYSWRKPWRMLAKSGVRTTRFRPPELIPPNFGINLRSHRKVLVCDTVGFTGGMNIADGNLLKLRKPGKHYIQDMHFKFEGPVVSQLRKAFLINWGFCTKERMPIPPLLEAPQGQSACRVVMDGPGKDADALNDLMCGAIDLARKKVRIMTPYFIPTSDLMSSLRGAALRGVDLGVVLPGHNNLDYMSWAMTRILPPLLKAGCRVWHQPPPFAHTKLLAIDGFYSLVGSANMDSRSLRLNFELNMEIHDPDINKQLIDFIDGKIAEGKEVTLQYLNSLPLAKKLRNSAIWVFSPYL